MENDGTRVEIKVTRKGDWREVCNTCRFTVRKKPIDHEPSEKFIEAIVRAEHSPIREIVYSIEMYNIPYWVAMHLRTHQVAILLPAVSTQRDDRTDNKISRNEAPQGALVNMKMNVNVQGLIDISRKRLCCKAARETRELWGKVIKEIEKIDPIVAYNCVPNCVYRNLCPELDCCGFVNSKVFHDMRFCYENGYLKGKERYGE